MDRRRIPRKQIATRRPYGAYTNLDDLVTLHIRRVLSAHGGNQVAAAKALGISRSTLRRKLGLS